MMSHDYTEASTEEDPRMIAFFDSLVQRELEGLSSDDSLSTDEEAIYTRIMQLSSSDSDSTISSISGLDATLDNTGVDELDDSLANSDNRDSSSVTDSGLGTSWSTNVSRLMHGGRANSPVSPPSKGKTLSRLIRKKKEGLKDGFYRNRSRLSTSSSSCSSSDEEAPVNTVLLREASGKPGKNPIAVQNMMKQRQQAMQASFVKLKRLNTLRNQVLNSDSDTEINITSKEIGESFKTVEENGESKEVTPANHKGKKHVETANRRPYVHQMCHMFEMGSPTEQTCSTSFDDPNTVTSSASAKAENDSKISDTLTGLIMKNVPKHLQANNRHETSEMSSQLTSKWKPVGLDSSNNHSSFHNNVNCDSFQTSLIDNKHAPTGMHGDHNNSITSAVETRISGFATKETVCSSQNGDKCNNDIDVAGFVSTNRIDDGKSELESGPETEPRLVVSEQKHVTGCNNSLSVSLTEKINESKDSDSSNKMVKKEVFTSMTEFSGEPSVVLKSQEKDSFTDESISNNLSQGKHKEDLDVFSTKHNEHNIGGKGNVRKDTFDNKIESKFSDSMPSCSTECLDQSLLSDYKPPDSPEVYRDAWTEFKKRKRSDSSKKHYRGHKRSDGKGSWD